MISAAIARVVVVVDDRRARRAFVPNDDGDDGDDDDDGREVKRRATSERAAVRHCPPEIFIIVCARERERERRAGVCGRVDRGRRSRLEEFKTNETRASGRERRGPRGPGTETVE